MSPESLFNAVFFEHKNNFVSKTYFTLKLEVSKTNFV